MNGLYDIYEKVYFKSLDDRERVVSRAQLNFTIYAGMLTLLFYMLRMIDYDSNVVFLVMFFFLSGLSGILLSISTYYTWIALSEGYKYKYLPKCLSVSKYRKELISYIQQVELYNLNATDKTYCPNVNEDIKEHLFYQLEECVDNNNEINNNRMQTIRYSMLWLWSGIMFFLVASLLFAAADLDVSSPRKDTLIRDTQVSLQLNKISANLNHLGEIIMANGDKNQAPRQPQPANSGAASKPVPPVFPRAQVVTESYKEKPKPEPRK
ncbi:hypothetical protein [Salmonella enterica]|uniref:Uncharacterized protein n=1 Tax=Salmonella enterica subsp. indica serovar 6,14,25:z10:1,(2),7 str. 1121 TaxID=1173950 RepID=V1HUA3_SALER|nr:hypothetical protein [Salmonella enterica]ESE86289.1 hypothetical protein SEI61121_07420 [Salmonella enterica subsp. indica serovar 6,14,25:z10:1,(2),7 str. 1121]